MKFFSGGLSGAQVSELGLRKKKQQKLFFFPERLFRGLFRGEQKRAGLPYVCIRYNFLAFTHLLIIFCGQAKKLGRQKSWSSIGKKSSNA
jgi:hypothetical protein